MTTMKSEHYQEILHLNQEVKILGVLENHMGQRIELERAQSRMTIVFEKRILKAGEKWTTYFDEFTNDD